MLNETPEGVTIAVWAKPGASKTRVVGRRPGPNGQEALEIALAAPPVDGAANRELIEFIGRALRVPKSRVELMRGDASRNKLLLVRGVALEEVVKALDP